MSGTDEPSGLPPFRARIFSLISLRRAADSCAVRVGAGRRRIYGSRSSRVTGRRAHTGVSTWPRSVRRIRIRRGPTRTAVRRPESIQRDTVGLLTRRSCAASAMVRYSGSAGSRVIIRFHTLSQALIRPQRTRYASASSSAGPTPKYVASGWAKTRAETDASGSIMKPSVRSTPTSSGRSSRKRPACWPRSGHAG